MSIMSDFNGGRILVIGGAGFIGSHVVDLLRKENVEEIIVYDNFCRGTRENLREALFDSRVRIFEAGGDVLQPDVLRAAMKGCQYVFHLAALWLLQCHDYPRSAFKVNVEGTFNVLEACREEKVERLVFSSSASVYGDSIETPMTEEHPFNNRTFYGATKIAGESMARAFHERYGLPYVGLRYMNVYGPRQDYNGAYVSVIMKILDRIEAGEPPVVYGDGTQSYDFIYVKDVARANLAALKAESVDEFYNVGSGRGTSIKQLCELLLELTGSSLPIRFEPAGQTFVSRRIGSIDKSARDLGFRSSVALREGLQHVIDWRRKEVAPAMAA